MKWSIPAKTFFLGEYAAIAGAPAILLTTEPCFELTLTNEPGLQGIHADSPAGRLWTQQREHTNHGLSWYDPYHGCGGLGASSAQWLGAYYALHYLQNRPIVREAMMAAFFNSAWQGVGIRPSGYDVLAQAASGCVYIDQQDGKHQCQSYIWPFKDLAFVLLHTGQKLATHQHLQSLTLTHQIESLAAIVDSAKVAFESADSTRIIQAVNAYAHALMQQHLVANHSLRLIESLRTNEDVLAVKGCGAMGADVILVLVPANKWITYEHYCSEKELTILATSAHLHG